MSQEIIGIIIVSAISTAIVMAAAIFAISYYNFRRNQKQAVQAIENIKSFMENKMREAQEFQETNFPPSLPRGKETSALTFRSTTGKMETVTIVVDYDLCDEDIAKQVRELGVEKLDTGVKGCSAAEIKDGADEFLFTGESYRLMQMNGSTPEDVVKRVLISQGRMRDVER